GLRTLRMAGHAAGPDPDSIHAPAATGAWIEFREHEPSSGHRDRLAVAPQVAFEPDAWRSRGDRTGAAALSGGPPVEDVADHHHPVGLGPELLGRVVAEPDAEGAGSRPDQIVLDHHVADRFEVAEERSCTGTASASVVVDRCAADRVTGQADPRPAVGEEAVVVPVLIGR